MPAVPRLGLRLQRLDAAADARCSASRRTTRVAASGWAAAGSRPTRPARSTSSPATARSTARAADWGDSYMRMHPERDGLDYFTPFNQSQPRHRRTTTSARAGRCSLPDQPGAHPHVMVGCGQGRDDLSRRPRQHGPVQQLDEQRRPDAPEHLPAERPTGSEPGNFSAPVYLNGVRLLHPERRQPAGLQPHERPPVDLGDPAIAEHLPRSRRERWRRRPTDRRTGSSGPCSAMGRTLGRALRL